MSGRIALTYDDGPHPVWTERVLAELRAADARATFFVGSPQAVVNAALVAATVADGHEVGLHCFRHRRHSEQTAQEVEHDLAVALDQLRSIGVVPRAWRAPWGIETSVTRRLASERGLRLWGWNLDSHDWRGDSAARMAAAVRAQGGLRDGDVALMHDGLGPGARREGCEATVELTRELLAVAASEELEAATVSDCAGVAA